MTIEFTLPDLGENIESGTVITILVATGDAVIKEQGILELETDKATVEVPIDADGVIKEIYISEGDEVAVGQRLVSIEPVNTPVAVKSGPVTKPTSLPTVSVAPAIAPIPSPPVPAPAPQAVSTAFVPAPAPIPQSVLRAERNMVPAAPNTRRLARELGVDIGFVTGTSLGGRISIDDVKRYARETANRPVALKTTDTRPTVPLPDFSKWGIIDKQSMSNIRKATATHMDRAWSTIPHVTQFGKADITDLEQLRKRFGVKVEAAGGKLTITAILLKVVSAALKEFPQFNTSLNIANHEVIYKQYYHIGVAVDTERGLLVPVIRDVDQKNIMELAVELGQIAAKARDRKLTLADMQGGTFTITNLGGIGGTNFTPIINTPEVAILGISRGGYEPVYNKTNSQFDPRLMLPLSLSYDHRIIDGADGARFIRWIIEYLEQPFLTALQGW